MNIFNMLNYNKGIVLKTNRISDDITRIIRLEKSYFKQLEKDQYFIKIYNLKNDSLTCIGYIYFYLDFQTRVSTFIGEYVNPQYRRLKLGTLLTSLWIKFCFDNGFYDLTTTKAQRKPFLLYILKNFSFELPDSSEYLTSLFNIHICKLPNEEDKYLIFENHAQALTFKEGKINKGNEHKILDGFSADVEKLDTVILAKRYDVQNRENAYQKAEEIINGKNIK